METPQSANQIETLTAVPHGLEEIIATFGDIHKYIGSDGQLDPRWQTDFLARMLLPFPLRLAWNLSQTITRMTCHGRLARVYASVFASIQEQGLQAKVASFGGCFAFRPQRTGNKLSSHSWGIAIDLNPESNMQGSAGNMDAGLVEIFRRAGFEWGGNWKGKTRDPMHFQFCTGY
ncbi:MAG: M15 family metallopeptidase [Terriglobales bacterium]